MKSWAESRLPGLRVTPNFVRSNRDIRRTGAVENKDHRQIQVLDLSVQFESWDPTRGIDEAELTYVLVGRSMERRDRYKILAVQTVCLIHAPDVEESRRPDQHASPGDRLCRCHRVG